MKLRSLALSAFALFFVVGMLSYHTASAGAGISVTQGSPATLHWSMTGGVQDCKGVTDYPLSAGDGVKAAWTTTHTADASGNGAVSFPSVKADVGKSYTFSCTNLATGVADTAVLTIVAPCGAGTVWNGVTCVPSAPAAGTPGQQA